MLPQTELIKALEKSTREATGTNYEAYLEKLKWLKDKWRNTPDSEELRILSPIVSLPSGLPLRPLDAAIVSDNLDYFQNNHQELNSFYLEIELAKACLCGSRQIGEFLLKKLNLDKLSFEIEPNYQEIFKFVFLSTNIQWKKDLALAMAQVNMKIPTIVYEGDPYELCVELCEIFKRKISLESSPSIPKPK